ncbi:unnamed protein product, partial [Timema podura]|nr:unnamed protein product [Timema podura]
ILVWWFNTKVALHNGSSGHGGGKHSNVNSNSHASQHACSSLCDEIVILWRLAAMNPGLSPDERELLLGQFRDWHLKIIEKVTKSRGVGVSTNPAIPGTNPNNSNKNANSFRNDVEAFSGFKPAVEACYLDWEDYPLPGITYVSGVNPLYHCPFTCFRHGESARTDNLVNSSQADMQEVAIRNRDGNRSSVSSEGFCENDADVDILNDALMVSSLRVDAGDTDSQEGGGSDSSSSGTSTSIGLSVPPPVSGGMDDNAVFPDLNVLYPVGLINGSTVPLPLIGPLNLPATAGPFQPCTSSTPNKMAQQKNISASTSSEAQPVVLESEPGASGVSVAPPEDTEASRRPSKDDSFSSNSDSQQSGDEYNVYYYDPKALVNQPAGSEKPKPGSVKRDDKNNPLSTLSVFANLKKTEDPWDILFARAEGLHAHGHGKEACTLGVRLAEELLANPPNLMIELPPMPVKGKRKKQYKFCILFLFSLKKSTCVWFSYIQVTTHINIVYRMEEDKEIRI